MSYRKLAAYFNMVVWFGLDLGNYSREGGVMSFSVDREGGILKVFIRVLSVLQYCCFRSIKSETKLSYSFPEITMLNC